MPPRVSVRDFVDTTPVLTENRTFVEMRGGRPEPLLKTAITVKFEALGGAKGFLGKPLGAEAQTPDGRGRFRHFEGGSIYSTGETGAHEVHGAIRELWAALGFEQSFLGYPTTDELPTPDGRGRFNHFEGGSIYWTPETGAHEIHGAIRELWAALGFEQGFLGYPTTDELSTPDGRGRFNHFEGGSIYWTPETGAHEVHGAIRELWAALGFEQGFLGYPTTDEHDTAGGRGGRFNHFEGGSVYWSPTTGVHEVHGAISDLWFSLGAETSALGLPVTDELDTPDGRGRFSAFEGGVISWSAELGAAVSSLTINEDGTPGLQIQGEGGSDQPAPIVRRRIVATAHMDLTDDEIGSNEHSDHDQTNEAVITDGLPQVVLTMQDGAGGELRVELQLTARRASLATSWSRGSPSCSRGPASRRATSTARNRSRSSCLWTAS